MKAKPGFQIVSLRNGDRNMSDAQTQGEAAVGFLVIAFTEETAGDEALKAMQKAKKEQRFYFANAAVIRQDANSKVHYKETGDMRMGKGAGAGALIGGVLGILGGPAGIAVGASVGAAIGAGVTHRDAGFKDESLQTVGQALKPGTSAVAVITSDKFLRAVQEQVPVDDIRTIVRNLAAEISAGLDEGKSVALGFILTETGLAFKEVAADENSVEVIGLAITNDAVIAGGAIETADGVDYSVAVTTEEGTAVEVGTVTQEGALIVDAVITDEGEAAVATVLVPDEPSAETPAEEEKPAEAGNPTEKPAAS
jgi:uncharacterized membrane protein